MRLKNAIHASTYIRGYPMPTLYIVDAKRGADMKNLSRKEAAEVLEDMKVKIEIPKAAVTQWKRNTALDMAIEALNCSEFPNNSDTISRQAAIDALKNDERYNEDIPNRADGVRDAIITVLSIPAANRWIPCKERLPDKYGFYLVTLNNGTTDFCLWNAMEFGWESSGIFSKCDEVTAWMPLPEPYKEEEGEL